MGHLQLLAIRCERHHPNGHARVVPRMERHKRRVAVQAPHLPNKFRGLRASSKEVQPICELAAQRGRGRLPYAPGPLRDGLKLSVVRENLSALSIARVWIVCGVGRLGFEVLVVIVVVFLDVELLGLLPQAESLRLHARLGDGQLALQLRQALAAEQAQHERTARRIGVLSRSLQLCALLDQLSLDLVPCSDQAHQLAGVHHDVDFLDDIPSSEHPVEVLPQNRWRSAPIRDSLDKDGARLNARHVLQPLHTRLHEFLLPLVDVAHRGQDHKPHDEGMHPTQAAALGDIGEALPTQVVVACSIPAHRHVNRRNDSAHRDADQGEGGHGEVGELD
mmetsp:Transcript_54561/g.157837  ORF Transcript_54561/g.157837 Transcript_54561/m.157837 type:complete len:334 (-) Transcript_54561:771-1772(-)